MPKNTEDTHNLQLTENMLNNIKISEGREKAAHLKIWELTHQLQDYEKVLRQYRNIMIGHDLPARDVLKKWDCDVT